MSAISKKEEKAFRRLERRADALATYVVGRFGEMMNDMPDIVAPQTLVDFFATALMKKDEQSFRWLLESYAAMRIQKIEAAKANPHQLHPTAH